LVNYGLCAPVNGTDSSRIFAQNALQAAGFQFTQDVDPRTGLPSDGVCFLPAATGGGVDPGRTPQAGCPGSDIAVPFLGSGIARNLRGNRLPQVPLGQVGVGAQYTFHLDGGYSFVPRVDYYYQSSFQSRVYNTPVIDRVGGWDTTNVNLQINAPDSKWYAALFAKNLFDKKNPTGIYLTDPTSALYTNVFAEDP